MTAVCPHCGFDLSNDDVITVGDLSFDPRGDIVFKGVALRFTTYEKIVLGTILKERGRAVSTEILRERIGYDGLNNVVEVMICRIRNHFRNVDPTFDLLSKQRRGGYRWLAFDHAHAIAA